VEEITSIICSRMGIITLNAMLTTNVTHMALTVNWDGTVVGDEKITANQPHN
jgi:hypothetical protein